MLCYSINTGFTNTLIKSNHQCTRKKLQINIFCTKISVIIQGTNNQKFKGFYIQARDQDGHPIGTFLIPDEKEAGVHNCFDLKNVTADNLI